MNFYRSAIGKKAVMAVTGLALFGFVLGHMAEPAPGIAVGRCPGRGL